MSLPHLFNTQKTRLDRRLNLVVIEFRVTIVDRRPDMKEGYVLTKYRTTLTFRVLWFTWYVLLFSVWAPIVRLNGKDYKGK